MGWSYRIATVRGIDVQIVLLVIAVLVLVGAAATSADEQARSPGPNAAAWVTAPSVTRGAEV